MPEILDCVKARSFVTSLKVLQDGKIAFATKLHGAKICCAEDCSVKLNFANERLNSSTTAICFDKSAQFIAFANDKVIYIVDIQSKNILKTISTNGESIQLLTFDENSQHIIAGSKNGRVLQYRFNSGSLIARLCSFPYEAVDRVKIRQNFVSAFAMHESKLATSGYGGTIIVIDIYSRANKIALNNGRSRTNALCFLNSDTLLSGNFDGVVKIFSIKNKKLLKEIDTPLTRIRQIVLMPNPNFIMLCSNTNYITVIDIINYKIIHNNYIEFKDVVTRIATLDDTTIVVSLKDGTIVKVRLPSIEKLRSFIVHNSLDKAFELVEREPMLQNTPEHLKLNSLYSKIYNDAIQALINQNITYATQLTSMFKNTLSKKKEISSLFIAFKNYNRFKVLYLEKKIVLAYAMCVKFPEFKNTPVYKKMEENWIYVFKNAQRQLLLGQNHNAKALLSEYVTVASKRSMIELILKQNKEFIQFIVAAKKKDYTKASLLASRNKLLQQIPSYDSLNKELDIEIIDIEKLINKGAVESARAALDKINNILHFKRQVNTLYKVCNHLEELQNHYEQNNFKECYESLDKYPILYDTKLGVLLNRHWNDIAEKCEISALKGNVDEIKNILGDLIKLEKRRDKIGDFLRLAFHVKIKAYIMKKAYTKAEKTIYSYIDIFGLDKEINILSKKFEIKSKSKLAITQELGTNRIMRGSWINSDLIDNGD